VSETTVSYVSSDSVCAQAATALAGLSNPGTIGEPVWVLKVGPSRYLVFNLHRQSAGKLLGAIFDESMTWLADIVL
jgi:hypothetical protein